MNDKQIVELYWQRNQLAIEITDRKYGPYCTAIAQNILQNEQDTKECINDTWLAAWNSMPPKKPEVLPPFLGRITRNLSFNKARYRRAQKRQNDEFALILDELAGVVSDVETTESAVDEKALIADIDHFLSSLSKTKKAIFVRRYFYCDSIQNLAKAYGFSENHISVTLSRTRKKLAAYLTERGYTL